MVSNTDPMPERSFAEHEHRDLVRGLNTLHDVACSIALGQGVAAPVRVLDVIQWFEHVLEPHIAWEESWLYPEIDRRIGTPWATRAARFDHGQIRHTADLVRSARDAFVRRDGRASVDELRCHLFGLEALVRAHIEREERFLIPSLEESPNEDPTGRSRMALSSRGAGIPR